MTAGVRVLVVDELTETADVLRAVLGPRGVDVERVPCTANRPDQTRGDAVAARDPEGRRFELVVVDAETVAARGMPESAWNGLPRVVIGTMRTRHSPADPLDSPPARFLDKPFHYADLLRTIEALIGGRNGSTARP